MNRNDDAITFVSKYLYFKNDFDFEIIKITTIFTETIFKNSKKIQRIRNYVPKCNLYLPFLI